MKKFLRVILVSLLLTGVAGCGSEPKTFEENLKDDAYKVLVEDVDGLDSIEASIKSDTGSLVLLYSHDGENSIFFFRGKKGNYVATDDQAYIDGGKCGYNLKTEKVSKDTKCSDDNIKTAKEVKQNYTDMLEDLNTTDKEAKKYLEKRSKKYMEDNDISADKEDPYDAGGKLESLGFILAEDQYTLLNNTTPLYEIGTPNTIIFDLVGNKALFIFDGEGTIMVDWVKRTVTEKDSADKMCIYDIETTSWLSSDCGIDKELRLLNSYTAFLKYLTSNEIVIESVTTN